MRAACMSLIAFREAGFGLALDYAASASHPEAA